jgi:hypothetical protein
MGTQRLPPLRHTPTLALELRQNFKLMHDNRENKIWGAGGMPLPRWRSALGGFAPTSGAKPAGKGPAGGRAFTLNFFRRVRSSAPRAFALKPPQDPMPLESRDRTQKPVAQTNISQAELP